MSKYNEGERRLFMWLAGRGTGFTSALFTLIARSDLENRERLSKAFPEEVQAYDNWNKDKYPNKIDDIDIYA